MSIDLWTTLPLRRAAAREREIAVTKKTGHGNQAEHQRACNVRGRGIKSREVAQAEHQYWQQQYSYQS
jgi:hypothetical protein